MVEQRRAGLISPAGFFIEKKNSDNEKQFACRRLNNMLAGKFVLNISCC
jgi:hypothetical protein